MKKTLLSLLLMTSALPAFSAENIPSKQLEARELAKTFLGQLKPALGQAMKSGGPVHAVSVCNQTAPQIAADLSAQSNWKVSRVSLKPRSKMAYADSWELETLKEFETQLAKGKDIQSLEKFAVVSMGGEETIRYMKAIPTGNVCLTCHGQAITPAVIAKLDKHYPFDSARGYQAGQIRGAFSFQQAVE